MAAASPAGPEAPGRYAVLGLGNIIQGDEALGGHVVARLIERPETLAALPFPDAVELIDGGTVGLGLIPYLDREKKGTGVWFGGPGGGRLVAWSAVFALLSVLAIEAVAIRYGWLRQWFPNVPQLVITLINPGTVLTAVYGAYSIWLVKKFNSTRAGALGLFTCFLVGFVVLTIIGTYFRGPNWDFYWSPSQWPGHGN